MSNFADWTAIDSFSCINAPLRKKENKVLSPFLLSFWAMVYNLFRFGPINWRANGSSSWTWPWAAPRERT